MRKLLSSNLFLLNRIQIQVQAHGGRGAKAAISSSLSSTSPHHSFSSRLFFSSRSKSSANNRLPPSPFGLLSGSILLKNAESIANRITSASVHRRIRSLAFSLQRIGGANRLFYSPRRFWTYWMQTPDGVVRFLIGTNIAVFFLWRVADPAFMRKHFMISLDNFKSGRLHTLLTSAFSHMDLDHLVTNMIGLYFFGTSIANFFGSEFLLKLYLAGALCGSVCFLVHKAFLVNKGYRGWDYSRAPALGASAAVNAIILLEVFLYPKRLVYLYFVLPVPAMLVGALLIGTDLWRAKTGQGHVSGSAHLGGSLVAALVWARVRKGWI
ncbi:RHOMBOID-like protein 12, mitochondrial [Typha angustifolia]|uniref:RHOMBOID-like protein 12, mitochondrial n=1 Tax=Typha angustifolia TaxID=59011 RepID=UPI003C2D1B8E